MAHYNKEDDKIVLETGKRIYSIFGIIGISPDGIAYYGFDGEVGEMEGRLTPEECKELALYQIELWKKYGGII